MVNIADKLSILFFLSSFRLLFSKIDGLWIVGGVLFFLILINLLYKWGSLFRGSIRVNKRGFSLSLIYIFVLQLSIFHAYISEVLQLDEFLKYTFFVIIAYGLAISLFIIKGSSNFSNNLDTKIDLFFKSLLIFVILNLLLFFLGVENPHIIFEFGAGDATILNSFGFELKRVFFPISSGLNTFGVICAISFFYSTVRLKTGSVLFFFNLCLIALSLLLLDSRSAIILSVLGFIALIVKFPEKVYLWGFRAVVLLLPASTFIAILLSSVLSGSLSESAVARNDTDIETFANRTIIWGAVFDVYSSFDVDHLFGFGVKGQVNSGVAEKNHQIFIKREDDYKSKTVHNLMLQSLLDIGYVGSFFFLVMLLSLNFKHSDYSKLLYSSLGAMLVAGFAEASPMIYQSELFYIFIVLVIIGLRPVSPQRANGMSNALS